MATNFGALYTSESPAEFFATFFPYPSLSSLSSLSLLSLSLSSKRASGSGLRFSVLAFVESKLDNNNNDDDDYDDNYDDNNIDT